MGTGCTMLYHIDTDKDLSKQQKIPETLRILFEPQNREQLACRLEHFTKIVLDRMSHPSPKPFPPAVDLQNIKINFQSELPKNGQPLEEILAHLEKHALPHCSNKRSKRYFAQMDIPPADLSVFSGLLIRAMAQDPIAYSSSRSGTFIEKQVIRWLSFIIYDDIPTAGGVITTGGTQSNLHALLLLRNEAFDKIGIDVSQLGLHQSLMKAMRPGLVYFASDVVHQSVISSLRYLGLGDCSLINVASDSSERMLVDDLETKIISASNDGHILAGIIATAGTTGSGAIDPINEIAKIAGKHQIPLHVDAAHGGMMLFSRQYKNELSGIQQATTVTIDPHKIMGLNQSLGFLAVQDKDILSKLGKSELQYYVSFEERDLGDFNIDNSRNLNSLGAWILLRSIGLYGYEKLVDHMMALTKLFQERILANQEFEILNSGPMNVVAFKTKPRIYQSSNAENQRIQRILKEILSNGDIAISQYQCPTGNCYLRAVFVNPISSENDVVALVDRLHAVAQADLNSLQNECASNLRADKVIA